VLNFDMISYLQVWTMDYFSFWCETR
jgi:hypothetical protein